MEQIILAPKQLARLVEYGEVTVNTPRGLVRLKVRDDEKAPAPPRG